MLSLGGKADDGLPKLVELDELGLSFDIEAEGGELADSSIFSSSKPLNLFCNLRDTFIL